MSLVIVLSEEEIKALDTILSALEGKDDVCWADAYVCVKPMRDRLNAAIADRAADEATQLAEQLAHPEDWEQVSHKKES